MVLIMRLVMGIFTVFFLVETIVVVRSAGRMRDRIRGVLEHKVVG